MLKKSLLSIVLVGLLAVFITGNVFAEERIAIVFATGGLGDKSFNDSAYEGMQSAEEELGIQFDQAEPTAITEYETYLTQFASTQRYDLIISIGFDQADALTKVANRFPDQKF
ncbi:MAG: BMP family protein, partial [Halanaerobiales bacterium]